MIYICEACGKECTPVLRDVGPSADCCFEARLLVMKPYGELGYLRPTLLTPDEERELAYELHDEADAERTPAENARNNWLNRS